MALYKITHPRTGETYEFELPDNATQQDFDGAAKSFLDAIGEQPEEEKQPEISTTTLPEMGTFEAPVERPQIPMAPTPSETTRQPIQEPAATVAPIHGVKQESAAELFPEPTKETEKKLAELKPVEEKKRPGIVEQIALRDLPAGIMQLKALAQAGLGLAAKASPYLTALAPGSMVGWETSPVTEETAAAASETMLKDYANTIKEVEENYPAVIGDYKNIKNLGDAGRYAVEGLVRNLPMFVPSMGAGGIGAVVARKFALVGLDKMIAEQTVKGLAKEAIEKNIAKYMIEKTATGATAGAIPASVGMEASSIYGDVYKDTGKQRPDLALLFGTPAGLLDAVGPIMAIRKVSGPIADEFIGSTIKRLGIEGTKQFFIEAPTGTLQTFLEEAAKSQANGKPLLTRQLFDNAINSFLQSGATGFTIGVGTQAAAETQKPSILKPETEEVKPAEKAVESPKEQIKPTIQETMPAKEPLAETKPTEVEPTKAEPVIEADKLEEIRKDVILDISGTKHRAEERITLEDHINDATQKWKEKNPDAELTPEIERAIEEGVDSGSRNLVSKLPSKAHLNSLSKAYETPMEGHVIGVTKIDLDFFKRVNDTFGHGVGDNMLNQVMNAVNQRAKKLDATHLHESGDENTIIDEIPEGSALEYYNKIANIKDFVENTKIKLPNGNYVPLSMTMGFAINKNVHEAISQAEAAMLAQKKEVKNSLAVDKQTQIDYTIPKGITGRDLSEEYAKSGLMPTAREVQSGEANVPVQEPRRVELSRPGEQGGAGFATTGIGTGNIEQAPQPSGVNVQVETQPEIKPESGEVSVQIANQDKVDIGESIPSAELPYDLKKEVYTVFPSNTWIKKNPDIKITWQKAMIPTERLAKHVLGIRGDDKAFMADVEAIKNSIIKEGLKTPLLVGKSNINGNHRIIAAYLAGLKEVPAYVAKFENKKFELTQEKAVPEAKPVKIEDVINDNLPSKNEGLPAAEEVETMTDQELDDLDNMISPITEELKASVMDEGIPMFSLSENDARKMASSFGTGVTEEERQAAFEANRLVKKPTKAETAKKKAQQKKEGEGSIFQKIMVPISEQLENINQELKINLRKYVFDKLQFMGKVNKLIVSFLKQKQKMTPADAADYDLAEKNGWMDDINRLNQKYNLTAAYENKRLALDNIYKEAKKAGFDLGYWDLYAPRSCNDLEGFAKYIKGEEGTALGDAINEKVSKIYAEADERQAEIQAMYDKKIEEISLKYNSKITDLRKEYMELLQKSNRPEIQQAIKNIDLGLEEGQSEAERAILNKIYESQTEMETKLAKTRAVLSEKIQEQASKKRELNPDEIWKIANTLIRGYQSSNIKIGLPGYMEARAVAQITPEMNKYYESSDVTLVKYVAAMSEAMSLRRFFGQDAVMKDEQLDVSESIGAMTYRLIDAGKMDRASEKRLKYLLGSYFNPTKMSPGFALYRTFEYMEMLGHVFSTITQISDQAFAIGIGGFDGWFKAALNKNQIDVLADLNIENLAAEFSDPAKSEKALADVLRAAGLSRMDRLGKDFLVNAAIYKFQAMANQPSKQKLLKAELSQFTYADKIDQVIEDLKAKKITDDILFMAFNTVMEFHPIDRSELPPAYSTSGNLKILYMLKTYPIKQLATYRTRLYRGLESKDPEIRKMHMMMLVRFIGGAIALGMGVDALKDWLAGRVLRLSDLVVDNILKTFCLSKYQIYKMKNAQDNGGLAMSAFTLAAPPFKIFESGIKDAAAFAGARKKGYEYKIHDMRIWESVPLAGKLYYWNLGGGVERTKANKIRVDYGTKNTEGSIVWTIENKKGTPRQNALWSAYNGKTGIITGLRKTMSSITGQIKKDPRLTTMYGKALQNINQKILDKKIELVDKWSKK